jgi:hypothetical protein
MAALACYYTEIRPYTSRYGQQKGKADGKNTPTVA